MFMKTILLEITTVYSLKARLQIVRKITIQNYFNKLKIEHTIRHVFFYVSKREFPICDVAQGLIGTPLILPKGIPLTDNVILQRKLVNAFHIQRPKGSLVAFVF